jgi:hypothetical protein
MHLPAVCPSSNSRGKDRGSPWVENKRLPCQQLNPALAKKPAVPEGRPTI